MNQRFSKGITALIVMLLALQAPVALAFSCADHSFQKTSSQKTGSEKTATVAMPMSKADCHNKMIPIATQSVGPSDCCDDCACPVAMSVALTSSMVELAGVPVQELISTPSILFVSLHPDRILHPPIS
jgi:hypothetical protein